MERTGIEKAKAIPGISISGSSYHAGCTDIRNASDRAVWISYLHPAPFPSVVFMFIHGNDYDRNGHTATIHGELLDIGYAPYMDGIFRFMRYYSPEYHDYTARMKYFLQCSLRMVSALGKELDKEA